MTPFTVQFLICTIDERIANVAQMMLPRQEGVSYLVSWQRTSARSETVPVPPQLEERPDVSVYPLNSRGLSANRNNALRHAQADILVIADDDCRYTPETIDTLRSVYAGHPEAKVILGRMTDEHGTWFKRYPTQAFNYSRIPSGYYPSSCEITLRKEAAAIPFDTAFGIGAPRFGCGEEEVWLRDASRIFGPEAVVFHPFTLCTTPPATTGSRFLTDKSVQQAKGAVLRIVYGPLGAALRIAKTAFTAPVPFGKRFRLLKEMLAGFLHVRHRTPNGCR